jgi:PAS domain-containing protein/two-component sensor histidine kinase
MDAFSGILGKIGGGIALQTLETEWKNKKGKAISVSLSISPIQNSRGIFIGASIIARDITERKRAEEALRISKQRLTDIIEHLPDATFAIDKDGIVIAWNKGMEEMTGVRAPDILNTGNYSYAIPFYGTRRPVFVDLLIHEDKVLEKMYPYIDRKDKKITSENFIPALNGGKGAYLWIFASPLFDSSGNVIGAIETIRDITDRKNMENALEQANRKIHLLNSITRHDILNQIMALNICLDMSREAVADPAVRSLLQQARRASENINDQISFTKEYQDIGIKSPEWQDVRETFIKAAASLNTGHIVIQPCERDLEVYADPLFEKVFYNLIDNSLKYGERLTRIRCAWKDEQERLLIIYEDDGVGIPVEDKKKIFRKGFGKHSGLGLFLIGEILAITRMTIAETGEPGKGARFEISVPSGSFRFRDR